MDNGFLAGVAVLLIVIFPFIPKLLMLRLKIFKKIGWDWGVRMLENHFDAWVLAGRIAIAMALLILVAIYLQS